MSRETRWTAVLVALPWLFAAAAVAVLLRCT